MSKEISGADTDVEVDVQYASSAGNLPNQQQLDQWVRAALCNVDGPAEVVIRLVDEKESADLNTQYRGKKGPTNVLSFPAEVPEAVASPLLGDLVICAQIVQKEANQQGKLEIAHWAHMVVHGVLHLLGYDHQGSSQAREMERHEADVMQQLGFDDPYRIGAE